MPIIHFAAADALQTKVIPAAIYPSEIAKIEGPNKSSSGKSYNWIVDVVVADGPYKGKTRTVIFNTESNNISMMGDMQFFPQAYFLQLDSAITGREIKPEDYALDTESLLHKPFDADWQIATVDGHMINTVVNFYPSGYGKSAPGF